MKAQGPFIFLPVGSDTTDSQGKKAGEADSDQAVRTVYGGGVKPAEFEELARWLSTSEGVNYIQSNRTVMFGQGQNLADFFNSSGNE